MSEIDQVHLRAVMLFMSEIVIIFNVKGHCALYKLEQMKNTRGKEGLLKLFDESQLNNDDYKMFSISLEVDTTLCLC